MKKNSIEVMLIFFILFLFLFSSIIPIVISDIVDKKIGDVVLEKIIHSNYGKNILLKDYEKNEQLHNNKIDDTKSYPISNLNKISLFDFSEGSLDSPWPMKCHDNHHTSLSPYSTLDNPYDELWNFKTEGWVNGGIVIDDDDILYFGDFDYYLYAVYPNGSLKWRYGRTGGWIDSTPAIAEDGTVYVGSWGCGLHAVYPNGTFKWRFPAGAVLSSSPAIADDGTIYFGNAEGRIFAINPNGTEKWHYDTGSDIWGDPAIADDGTIYIGSWDNYFYALYPNGTLRWRFQTGNHIKGPPSIADDGTIYFGSWDNYLYALYPNGTMKWRHQIGLGTESNPSIGPDGTIYCGGGSLYAVYPNGTRKWTFDFGDEKRSFKSSPAICSDGIIYISVIIGDDEGGEILAVNPDGTERWRRWLADNEGESSPCIGSDSTIYVGSSTMAMGDPHGNLHAIGNIDPNAPAAPTITGELNGRIQVDYEYTFSTIDPNDDEVLYNIEWGDGKFEDWFGPYDSGEEVVVSHTWSEKGDYTIRARAKDTHNLWGPWGELEVSMPVNQQSFSFPLLQRLLERFPNAFPILQQILGL